ncbi:MAG: glycosyltransferase family 2 protein [Polyangiales bacterium]
MPCADIVLALLGAGLSVPVFVLFVEVVASLFRQPKLDVSKLPTPSTVVLIPAHNEERGISKTIASIRKSIQPGQSILVVADNCTDKTALKARENGAEVIERTNASERGKGYALSFGFAHLQSDPPQVVIVVDADCELNDNAIPNLAKSAVRLDRPVQAEYEFIAPSNETRSLLSALATVVRNIARPRGLRRMGLPTQLVGTGMAFPWDALMHCPPMGGYLVEDMLMGIELAKAGFAPVHLSNVHVRSRLPEDPDAALAQRKRWEQGHLQTLFQRGPRLVAEGILTRNVSLLAMGLDLLVPPLALLAIGLVLFFIGAFVVWGLGASGLSLSIALSLIGLFAASVMLARWKLARQSISIRSLLLRRSTCFGKSLCTPRTSLAEAKNMAANRARNRRPRRWRRCAPPEPQQLL